MLAKKEKLLQIRVQEELLARFKKLAESQGATSSAYLRFLMEKSCERYEDSLRAKAEHSAKGNG